MAEVLGSRECRDEDDGGSLCDDGDSWCVVDSKENNDVRGWKDAGVNTRPFYSRCCGSNEPNSFQKNFDAAASGDLSVTTRQCDRQKVAESAIEFECWNCRNNIKEQFERQVDDCGRITRWLCYQFEPCMQGLHSLWRPKVDHRAINEYTARHSIASQPVS